MTYSPQTNTALFNALGLLGTQRAIINGDFKGATLTAAREYVQARVQRITWRAAVAGISLGTITLVISVFRMVS